MLRSVDRKRVADELRAEGLLVTEWRDEPDARYDTHAHPYREVRVVLDGDMTFIVGSQTLVLGPGERIDLAPGQPHAARVGSGGATYLAGTDRSQ